MSNAIEEPTIIARLAEAQVKCVLVVDDAFDAINLAEVEGDLTDFWDPFMRSGSDGLKKELQDFVTDAQKSGKIDENATLGQATDLTENVLNFLYETRGVYPDIKAHAESTIFADRIEKLEPVRALCENLKSIGVDVKTCSSDVDLSQEHASVVFLDYYLGATDDDEAIEHAKTRVREIYGSVAAGEPKPFVVLMSSKAMSDVQRRFCDEAGLLHGLLTFAPKSELKNHETLCFHLATWALHLPQRHAIQSFVDALESSMGDAVAKFKQRVRGLSIEDYANLQWMSLQADGHPLGDYMLWLCKSLLSHLLHDNATVLEQQKQLDGLSVSEFLPSQSPPSSDLADMFRCALTVPGVGEAAAHPQSLDGGDLQLELGDLFFHEHQAADTTTLVYIVLNPACDLAYSPASNRTFPSDRYILFIRGVLESIHSEATTSLGITQPFSLAGDNNVYRIRWSSQNAEWKKYGECRNWVGEQKLSRIGRLAIPYALELQRAFTANFMRIGTPIPPPVISWRPVAICCYHDSKWHELEVVTDGVQLIRKRDGEDDYTLEFVLTKNALLTLSCNLEIVLEWLNERKGEFEGQLSGLGEEPGDKKRQLKILEGKLQGICNQITKVTKLTTYGEHWLKSVQSPRSLPDVGMYADIDPKLLRVYHDADYGSNFPSMPVVINIKAAAQAKELE